MEDQTDSGSRVVVIGAGPAGLTAALALAQRGLKPLVIEAEPIVGGISRTLEYKGNRMDIGGHRFFSKSEYVMDWWQKVLPLQGAPSRDDVALKRIVPLSTAPDAPDPEHVERVMLSRCRLSRIYFLRKFFDYPVSLTVQTIRDLGLGRTARIGMSYLQARLTPIRPERSLEDFMVNRFGRTLYELFFRDYTEKVWGVPCSEIRPEWGAQRIKGLSIAKAIAHALSAPFKRKHSIEQEGTETSLIGRFLYPKLGPGQLWETVAEQVVAAGGEILLDTEVMGLTRIDGRIASIEIAPASGGSAHVIPVSSALSTMPIKDLIGRVNGEPAPAAVAEIAAALPYRDFITCGLLVKRLTISNRDSSPVLDNWIYIQERDVRLGRLQVFSNWSPYLVADKDTVWLGLEYFADEGDEMWTMDDARFSRMAAAELAQIGIIAVEDVLDSVVVRIKKAYPAYFGVYDSFDTVREWLDSLENLWVMGRNGMHRYNNMDHSMLTAWAAVDALCGEGSRESIWNVNADEEYHESK